MRLGRYGRWMDLALRLAILRNGWFLEAGYGEHYEEHSERKGL